MKDSVYLWREQASISDVANSIFGSLEYLPYLCNKNGIEDVYTVGANIISHQRQNAFVVSNFACAGALRFPADVVDLDIILSENTLNLISENGLLILKENF